MIENPKPVRLKNSKNKTLHGMLPICASCKKIRNDKGYWEQVEVYIRDHSDVQFSHGLCPSCFKELYPGYEFQGEDKEAVKKK